MTTKTTQRTDTRRFLAGLFGGTQALAAIALGRGCQIVIQISPLRGFQYHHGEAPLQQLRDGDTLTLVREAGDLYNDHAACGLARPRTRLRSASLKHGDRANARSRRTVAGVHPRFKQSFKPLAASWKPGFPVERDVQMIRI